MLCPYLTRVCWEEEHARAVRLDRDLVKEARGKAG